MNFFEIKAKYNKVVDSGKESVVSENYIVSAVSLSDSEKVIHEELEPYISGDLLAVSSKYANFSEIIPNVNGGDWFKCKLELISIDEERGTEKRSNMPILVQSETVKSAYDSIQESFKGSVADFQITSVTKSNIVDVFMREIDAD